MRTSLTRRISTGLAGCLLSALGFVPHAWGQAPVGPPPQPSLVPPSPAAAQGPKSAARGGFRPGDHVFHIAQQKSKLSVTQLQSRILELPNRIQVVTDFNEDTLEVTALSSNRVRLFAKAAGATSITLIDEFDNSYTVEVFVEADVRELQAYIERLFPGAAIEVLALRDSVVLRGWVTEPDRIPQIIAVAKQFYPNVHNQMSVGGVTQVQLHVKVLEVQRSKLERMGINFLGVGENFYVHSGPGNLAPLGSLTVAPAIPPTGTFAPAALANSTMSFAVTGSSGFFHAFVDLLRNENMAKILAEPVLVTTSGRPATMLSGGEFPVLVPGSVGTTTIQFREFGVRMEAVPIVLGNGRLRLDIAPEVSEKDIQNAVQVNGFTVPGIITRRVNTQVEMRFGETLMIGGLIQRKKVGSTSKIPFLGELPWIGAAFSRKSFEMGETELLILVTPHMAAPMQPGQVPSPGLGFNSDDPVTSELYLDGMIEVPYYGPDCPDGNCPVDGAACPVPPGAPAMAPGEMILPGPAIPDGALPAPAPAPAAAPPLGSSDEAASAGIEQTSGVSSNRGQVVPLGDTTNPFRSSKSKAKEPARTESTSKNPVRRPVPGLIRPQGNSKSPES